jgi:hypothetical protein
MMKAQKALLSVLPLAATGSVFQVLASESK